MAFVSALALPALRHVRLERTALCDKGALALAASPHLAGLRRLTLNEPRWKDETIQLFASSTTLAQTQIWLKGHPLNRAAK